MQLAMDDNLNYSGVFPQLFCGQQVVSFQTDPGSSSSGALTGSLGCSAGVGGSVGIINSSCSMASPSNSPSVLVDTGHGLKYNTAMSVDWSYQELALLKDGLERYGNEPSIMKYIKIAANLPDKTVRDVALRCQWMMKRDSAKRRKHDENYPGKRIRERKEKFPDSMTWMASPPTPLDIKPSPSYMVHNVNNVNPYACGVAPELDNAIRHSLEENARLLNQIATNIVSCQGQNNFDLFVRTRSNITAILDSMSQMPGIMSKMPPLPVSMNDNLASFVLPTLPQTTIGHSLGISHLKDEPAGW